RGAFGAARPVHPAHGLRFDRGARSLCRRHRDPLYHEAGPMSEAVSERQPRDEYELPNPGPRPEGEEEELLRIWARPRGWRLVSAVNNTVVGILYIGTAFLFFLLAGVLALVMRT